MHIPGSLSRSKLGLGLVTAVVVLVVAVALDSSPADGASSRRSVWVGAGVDGSWPSNAGCSRANYPSANCSLPKAHHTYAHGKAGKGDWGVDIVARKGASVWLYSGPEGSAPDIYAKVDAVVPACASRNLKHGGSVVTVGLYETSARSTKSRIGQVSFAHIEPAKGISKGKNIGTWRVKLGTIGQYTKHSSNTCWTGLHLHQEVRSDVNFACWYSGHRPNARISAANFVGYMGGRHATKGQQACR